MNSLSGWRKGDLQTKHKKNFWRLAQPFADRRIYVVLIKYLILWFKLKSRGFSVQFQQVSRSIEQLVCSTLLFFRFPHTFLHSAKNDFFGFLFFRFFFGKFHDQWRHWHGITLQSLIRSVLFLLTANSAILLIQQLIISYSADRYPWASIDPCMQSTRCSICIPSKWKIY